MKAILKSVDLNGPVGFEKFCPEDVSYLGFWLTFEVGPENQDGGHLFQVFVCTPSWLENNCPPDGAIWGRHMLIVRSFNKDRIVQEIRSYIDSCTESDFWELAKKVSRVGAWEYEDYKS